MLNKRIFFNVKGFLNLEILKIKGNEYTVLKITLTDKDGKLIFKEPMMLITSLSVQSLEEAYFVYRGYMKRSKIEAVFKFLKDVLGWEDFRVRDYESIRTLITLCYFVGGYFYETEKELAQSDTVKLICKTARSKGKVTKFFIMKGLQTIIGAIRTIELIRNEVENPEELFDLLAKLSGMDRKRFDILIDTGF